MTSTYAQPLEKPSQLASLFFQNPMLNSDKLFLIKDLRAFSEIWTKESILKKRTNKPYFKIRKANLALKFGLKNTTLNSA